MTQRAGNLPDASFCPVKFTRLLRFSAQIHVKNFFKGQQMGSAFDPYSSFLQVNSKFTPILFSASTCDF